LILIRLAMAMNRAARQLGRLGRGKKKTISLAERRHRERLAEARKKRWPKKR
jgi:hypothetical protein